MILHISDVKKRIPINRTKDPFGWMGNMSDFGIEYNGLFYKNAESLFQCLRFEQNNKVIDLIRNEKNPFESKQISIEHRSEMIIEPGGKEDVENMRLVVGLKVKQHEWIRSELRKIPDYFIYENVVKRKSGRNLIWGGYFDEIGQFIGQNILGNIWMELRDKTIDNLKSIL